MEPELVEQPPKGDGWSHEVKFDGYRTQLIKDVDGIRLYTKTGIDWTAKYRPLAEEAAALDAESFIIDIARAAFFSIIANADQDHGKVKNLQAFAIAGRVSGDA